MLSLFDILKYRNSIIFLFPKYGKIQHPVLYTLDNFIGTIKLLTT